MVKVLRRGKREEATADTATAEAESGPASTPEASADAPVGEARATEAPAPDMPAPPRPATYDLPAGEPYEPPISFEPAPPPPPPPRSTGGLLDFYKDAGEQTAAERERVAAMEFEQAIAPVMELMRASVPEASTPEEAARILAANQDEITPDPQGGAYVHGDAFDADARVYYRLLRRNYEKNPRPSQGRTVSPHLHGTYGKLTGTKGW